MSERVASLDLVRGLAACSVAFCHYLTTNSQLWPRAETISILAVEVFFVLSGFVLAPQIIRCSQDGRAVNLMIFLVRRWMRTVPPYLLALAAISILTGQLLTGDFIRYCLYLQNFIRQSNIADYYPVAWSLSVEEWFYVTFPLLVFIGAKATPARDFRFYAATAITFIVAITILRLIFGSAGTWDDGVRRIVAFRLDSIAYGFLLYLLIDRYGPTLARTFNVRRMLWASAVFVAATLLGYLTTRMAVLDAQRVAQQAFPFIAAVFGASAIIAFLSFETTLASNRIATWCCIYLGRISYSIYLFHLMVILLLRPHLQSLPLSVQFAIYGASLLLLSSVLYRYVEKPILEARPAFRTQDTPTADARGWLTIANADAKMPVRIAGVCLAVILIAISASYAWGYYLAGRPLPFYLSAIAVAGALSLLSLASGLHHIAIARSIAPTALCLALLLPLADHLYSKSFDRLLVKPPKPAHPVYSFREAKGDPKAFQDWFKYYADQWVNAGQKTVEGPDPKGVLPLILIPNSSGTFFNSAIKINSAGFRGRELEPGDDRYRIFAIGESPTFGPTLEADDLPWPDMLQRLIDQRLSCMQAIDVINAGTGAYDLRDNLERLRRDIVPLKPDLVVSYHSFNSLRFLDPAIRSARATDFPEPVVRASSLFADLEARLQINKFIAQEREAARTLTPTFDMALRSELAGMYRTLIEIGRRHNFTVALANSSLAVTSQSPNEVIDFYGRVFISTRRILAVSELHDQLVEAIAHDAEIPFIDTKPGLAGGWDDDLFLDLVHFARKGNAIMAEHMFNGLLGTLRDHPRLKCRPRDIGAMGAR